MTPPDEPLHTRVLMADLARAHYLDGRSKIELSEQFGVNRFQIARLLERAREVGIVTIEVHDPRVPRSADEQRLADVLGVDSVRIVGGAETSASDVARLGGSVLDEIANVLRPGMTLGISWSRTLDSAAHLLATLPRCTVVQLTGAFEIAAGGTFRRLLAQLDRRSDVTAYPLYAPLLVDRIETADDLRRQPVVAAALQRADALDVAVVAIGAWQRGESAVWDRASPGLREACAHAGAVAEFSGLFVGENGHTVSTPLDGRVIGVTMEQLRGARHVIGFAAGAARADAVRAASRSGVFSTLVVDTALADALLS